MGTYNSTDTPVTTVVMNSISDQIVVSDSYVSTKLTVTINVTAPDEGFGADPTLLKITLNFGGYTVRLHDGTSDSVNTTYPTTLTPADPLTPLIGLNVNGTWTLGIFDFSSTNTGTLNSWSITTTPVSNPGAPLSIPTAPVISGIPSGITYGFGGNIRRNEPLFFNTSGPSLGLIDTPRLVPFNSNIQDIAIGALYTGGIQSQVSLHKILASNQQDVLLTSGLGLAPMNTNYALLFPPIPNKAVNKGDFIYANLDSGVNIQGLTVRLVLNSRG